MKKNKYIVLLIILLSLYSITLSPISERQKRRNSAQCTTDVSPAPRAPPADSLQYSVRINGQTNSVLINGKTMKTTSDTTNQKNTIRVSGEGNKVTVIQDDHKSEVIISQQGKNNRINISQK